jgi:ferritin-like metal-binding protein YciE
VNKQERIGINMKTLRDLFIDQVEDLYNAEKQITKALPQMAEKAASQQLKETFQNHLKETQNHVSRLEKVFQELNMSSKGKKCEAIEGIIKEGKEMIEDFKGSDTIDSALIAAAQKVEHYEIATYGTVRSFAEQLKLSKVGELLAETLEEEYGANKKLNGLAINTINVEAPAGM